VEPELGIEDGVVGGDPLAVELDLAQDGVVVAPEEVELLVDRAQPEKHLVAAAVGRHQQADQHRPLVADRLGIGDVDRRRLLAACVPALLGEVPAELLDRDRRHGPGHQSTNSNQ
jgi:hypothetical protein